MVNEYDIKKFLKSFSSSNVDLLRFPGNYGDAVIHQGTKQILKESDITYQIISCCDEPQNDILLVDGGGNLVDYYNDVSDYILSKGECYSKIVILPHTIFGENALSSLRNVENRLTVFCRERESYRLVTENLDSEVFLCHDNAFELNINEYFDRNIKKKGKLNAFRTDVES